MNIKLSIMRGFFVWLFCLVYCTTFADTMIQMESYGGVYRVPCTVNGAKMKFIFDTGASSVCLSMAMAEYLYDNGLITDNDIIGKGTSSVADGRIVDHIKIILRDIQIGNLHLTNVESIVIKGQDAPLLMGQSAIQKMGRFEINGNLLIIHSGIGDNEDEYISNIRSQFNNALRNNEQDKLYQCLETLYNLNQAQDDELYLYALNLYIHSNYSKSIEVLDHIKNIKSINDDLDYDVYRLYGKNYLYLEGDNNLTKAIGYYYLSNCNTIKTFYDLSENYKEMGIASAKLNSYKDAFDYIRKAMDSYAITFDQDFAYLWADSKNELKKKQKSYRNDETDELAYLYITYAEKCGACSTDTFLNVMIKLSKAKNRYATKLLNEIGVNAYDY